MPDIDGRCRIPRPASPGSLLRHRIVSGSTPRMAATDPTTGQPTALPDAVPANGLHRISRTGGLVPTTPQGPKQSHLHRRKQPAIGLNQSDDKLPSRFHGLLNSPAWFNIRNRLPATAGPFCSTMERRAIKTSATGRAKSCWCKRKASRKSRRARFRSTDAPMRRPVIMPSCDPEPSGKGNQLAIIHPATRRSPCSFIRRNSRGSQRRIARDKRKDRAGLSLMPPGRLVTRASDGCGPSDGGWIGWLGHLWWTSDCGTRAGERDGFSMVDTVFSCACVLAKCKLNSLYSGRLSNAPGTSRFLTGG